MKKLKRAAILLAFVLLAGAKAKVLTGVVTNVSDGDTITILNSGKPVKVRLFGIDAPEAGQDYGDRAHDLASALAFNEIVVVDVKDHDQFGRVIGEVKFKDGRSLNAEMLRAGLAWWYKHYAPEREDFKSLEQKARKAKIGLWNDPNPIPPWEYRQYPFCASKTSGVYHPCDCPTISERIIPPANLIRFKTEPDAQNSGRKRCKCQK